MTMMATSERPAGFASVNGRIRVLWLIKGLGPGGAELLLPMLAEARDRERFDYEAAYLLPWKRAVVGDLESQGVTVHCLDGGREWNLGWALRLHKLLRARAFDIVHVHSPYVAGIARLVIRGLPSRSRPRIVYTEHVPWWSYSPPTRALNALTFGLDDAHLAVSDAVRASIRSWRRHHVSVVYHGVSSDKIRKQLGFRDDVRRQVRAHEDDVVIGTVANYRTQKAYPDLLQAARIVIDRGLPVRFVAVGQGPLEHEIRELHQSLGLQDRFVLAGYRRDATRVLAGCDLFVLASHYEGLPIALLEALALGLPVVATAVGGIPECMTDGLEGYLVQPSRPDLLAEALRKLVQDHERRDIMARAAQQRGAEFDIRRASRTIEALYLEVITQ
jgi:glycosyltransferase involved in cell wall biosynthesis